MPACQACHKNKHSNNSLQVTFSLNYGKKTLKLLSKTVFTIEKSTSLTGKALGKNQQCIRHNTWLKFGDACHSTSFLLLSFILFYFLSFSCHCGNKNLNVHSFVSLFQMFEVANFDLAESIWPQTQLSIISLQIVCTVY